MVPSENQQHLPDPAPPSLSAGGHESRDYYAAQDASRPPSQNEPYPTPYLGLRARLSQTWINRWTILLLLVLIRTIFAIASVDHNLAVARKQVLSACTSVESVGSAMASMPHYMSEGLNELTAKSIEKAINGLMEMLLLTVTGVEEIVVFVINMLTQTYLCLITLAISGSLHVAVSVAEDVGDFLNSTAKDIGEDLGDVAGDFQKAMNGFLSGINDIGNLFGGHSKPPSIDLASEIQKLDNLQLPASYDQGLRNLNKSIPTFAQVNNLTQTAIRFPFEEVKTLLNQSLPKYKMDRSIFPVPAKQYLTFCSDNAGVNDFFDDLVHIERLAKKVFYAVIIVLAVLAMIPMGFRELRRWRKMQERAKLVNNESVDSMDAVYLVSRPYTSSFGLWISKRFPSPRHRALVRWSVAYATTVPALFVLSLALAGLLSCLCQYTLLHALQQEVPKLENQVIDFTDKVMIQLNNASEQWAVGTNAIITNTSDEINHDVFGWVNTTTGAINNTLNVFVDEMTGALNETFGGTILYDPILEVLNCLVLLKIQGIQKGLTWVGDHAKVDLPLLPNDTFSLGTAAKYGGAEPNLLATGSDGAAADAITEAVGFVLRSLEASIRQEAIISTCVLLIWVVIALIGFVRAAFLMCQRDKTPHIARSPPSRRSSTSTHTEKFELQEFPKYERAAAVTQPGDHRGNLYNGQSYTLTPAPMPVLNNNGAAAVPAGSPPPLRSNPFLKSGEFEHTQRNPFVDPGR